MGGRAPPRYPWTRYQSPKCDELVHLSRLPPADPPFDPIREKGVKKKQINKYLILFYQGDWKIPYLHDHQSKDWKLHLTNEGKKSLFTSYSYSLLFITICFLMWEISISTLTDQLLMWRDCFWLGLGSSTGTNSCHCGRRSSTNGFHIFSRSKKTPKKFVMSSLDSSKKKVRKRGKRLYLYLYVRVYVCTYVLVLATYWIPILIAEWGLFHNFKGLLEG